MPCSRREAGQQAEDTIGIPESPEFSSVERLKTPPDSSSTRSLGRMLAASIYARVDDKLYPGRSLKASTDIWRLR
jgi:seryl-tRNA synthetase